MEGIKFCHLATLNEGRPLRRLRPRPQEQGKARRPLRQAQEAVRLRQEQKTLHRAVRDQLSVGTGLYFTNFVQSFSGGQIPWLG